MQHNVYIDLHDLCESFHLSDNVQDRNKTSGTETHKGYHQIPTKKIDRSEWQFHSCSCFPSQKVNCSPTPNHCNESRSQATLSQQGHELRRLHHVAVTSWPVGQAECHRPLMDLARTNGTIVASHCGPETSETYGKIEFFFFLKSFKPHLHKYTKTWCNFGSHSSCQLHLGSLGFLQLFKEHTLSRLERHRSRSCRRSLALELWNARRDGGINGPSKQETKKESNYISKSLPRHCYHCEVGDRHVNNFDLRKSVTTNSFTFGCRVTQSWKSSCSLCHWPHLSKVDMTLE